ncbi:MAG: hypothetical protein NTV11_02020 [Rhodocyclales bacterium]|nr:hypothetical protein [Rhodocyclales bacterium]
MDTLKSYRRPARQQGFVLILALLIMVVITLSAVAMITSLRGGISASGNIAFRQAATRAADVAVDDAFQWVSNQLSTVGATALDNSKSAAAVGATAAYRYYAIYYDADAGCSKNGSTTFTPQSYRFSDTTNGNDGSPCAGKMARAPAGYGLYYVVHRMAGTAGACPGAGCLAPSVVPTSGPGAGCSMDPSDPAYCGASSSVNNLVYYRITVKVVGPRQNTRYIQTFVY